MEDFVSESLYHFEKITVPVLLAELPTKPALLEEKMQYQATLLWEELRTALPHACAQRLMDGKNRIDARIAAAHTALVPKNEAAIDEKAQDAAERATRALRSAVKTALMGCATNEPMAVTELRAKWEGEKKKALAVFANYLIDLIDTAEAIACSKRIEKEFASLWCFVHAHTKTEDSHIVSGTVFRVDWVYKDLKYLGKGGYGIVCSAVNSAVNENVAIKRVSTHHAKLALREIRMMRYLGTHENIITLKDLYLREADEELYIVMELLDSDLHRIIQSKQALSTERVCRFTHQLLKGLKFLHDHRIIHRDLKPGNLLVTRSCELRISDFGLARARPAGKGPNPDEFIEEPMTELVVTQWSVVFFKPPTHPLTHPPTHPSTHSPTH